LEGALEFLRELRSFTQVVISRTLRAISPKPLLRQLEWPTCSVIRWSWKTIGSSTTSSNPEQKTARGRGPQSPQLPRDRRRRFLQRHRHAREAHIGFLFHAPEAIKKQFPQFKAVRIVWGVVRADQAGGLTAGCGESPNAKAETGFISVEILQPRSSEREIARALSRLAGQSWCFPFSQHHHPKEDCSEASEDKRRCHACLRSRGRRRTKPLPNNRRANYSWEALFQVRQCNWKLCSMSGSGEITCPQYHRYRGSASSDSNRLSAFGGGISHSLILILQYFLECRNSGHGLGLIHPSRARQPTGFRYSCCSMLPPAAEPRSAQYVSYHTSAVLIQVRIESFGQRPDGRNKIRAHCMARAGVL